MKLKAIVLSVVALLSTSCGTGPSLSAASKHDPPSMTSQPEPSPSESGLVDCTELGVDAIAVRSPSPGESFRWGRVPLVFDSACSNVDLVVLVDGVVFEVSQPNGEARPATNPDDGDFSPSDPSTRAVLIVAKPGAHLLEIRSGARGTALARIAPTRIEFETRAPAPREPNYQGVPYTRAEAGVSYFYALSVHCGVNEAFIDGRWWDATPDKSDGEGNPPPYWNEDGGGTSFGAMVMVSRSRARFVSDFGLVANFVPRKGSQVNMCE